MMKLKSRFYTSAAKVLSVVAICGVGIASLGSFYEPEIPEELE